MNTKIFGVLAIASVVAACNSPPPPSTEAGAATGAGSSVATSGPAPGSQEDLVAKAGDRVFFATNRSSLSSEAQGTLDRQASFLTTYSQDSVQIAGNCDERGTSEYNIALGQRRANSARDYLVAKGVSGARVETISYGKDRPTALGSDESAWQQNRNAITTVR